MALPWCLELGNNWKIATAAQLSAGWIGDGWDAGIASLGPVANFRKTDFPIGFECGMSPTGVSRPRFETKDIGSSLQFTSYGGIFWDAPQRLRIAYRYEHLSSAGLAQPNPGLNLHVLSVSCRF